jgi:hypothetical protein
VLLPLALFGTGDFARVYGSWIEHLRFIAATVNQSDHRGLIALPFILTKKLGADSSLLPWLLRGASVLWLGAVAVCVLIGATRRNYRADGWDLAVDAGILVLAPVVISPYLEAHHPVVAILPILALVQRAIATPDAAMARIVAGLAMGGGWLALRTSPWGYRGFGVFVQMLLIVLALAAVRFASGRSERTARLSPADDAARGAEQQSAAA